MGTIERGWVERARRGDADAFEALVRRYERQIYSFTYRMLGDADDAADLTQESFVKAYRALPRARPDTNVSAWLHRIAANACLDVLRRRQRLRWLPWNGARHDHLLLGGPADKAGVQPGDIILRVGKEQVERSGELPNLVAGLQPGTKTEIVVWRNGKQTTLPLTVGELNETNVASAAGGGSESGGKLGLAVRPLSPAERKQLESEGGVVVENAQGPAAQPQRAVHELLDSAVATDRRLTDDEVDVMLAIPIERHPPPQDDDPTVDARLTNADLVGGREDVLVIAFATTHHRSEEQRLTHANEAVRVQFRGYVTSLRQLLERQLAELDALGGNDGGPRSR